MTNRMRAGLFVLGGLLSTVALGASGLSPALADSATAAVAPAVRIEAPDVASIPEAEVEPGDTILVGDAELTASAAIELSGEILVTIAEDTHSHDDGEVPAVEHHYSVETADGTVVPIAGDIPETVSTGDTFEGTVAVGAEVVEQLTEEAAAEVDASSSGAAVPEESEATQEVLVAASSDATELPVIQGQVTVAAAAATTAQRHELVFVVNSPPVSGVTAVTHSDAEVRALGAAVATHWRSSSNGLISEFAVNQNIVRTFAGACDESAWVTWDRAATTLGFTNWSDFKAKSPAGTARHLVVLLPEKCKAAAGTGVGIVGSSLHYGGAVRQIIGGGADVTTLAHEVGHNFGLGHANLHYCTGTSCTQHEYWDVYDVMGLGIVGRDYLTPLNATTATRLGFMPTASVQSLSLAAGTTTQTLTTTLTRLSATSGIRHVRLTDPITGEVFSLELRDSLAQPAPYYVGNPTITPSSGRSVTVTPGVRMLRASGNGSAVIAASQPTGLHRTAIQAGQSIQSPSGGIKITAVSGSPNSAMQLSVTLSSAGQPSGAAAPSAASSIPVYRFWSDAYQGHFYTASAREKAHIIATYPSHIWRYETIAYQGFATQVAGTVPLYRFWSDTMNGHFYTASESEKNHVVAAYDDRVWKYEGIAYYVYPMSNTTAAAKPVYRFWSVTKRHHFYTASESEKKHVIATYARDVWAYEQAAYKVPTS